MAATDVLGDRLISRPAGRPAHNELIKNAVSSVIRSCDYVFGATGVLLALYGTWLLLDGQVHLSLAVALWSFVALNLICSALARRHNAIFWDLTRGVLCLPLAAFLYVDRGSVEKLWVPALMLTVDIALSTGIASRRSRLGMLTALGYAGTLLAVDSIANRTLDFDTVNDMLGIALTGIVTSLVARKLGRMLDEVRHQHAEAHQQRDRAESAVSLLTERSRQLTTALDELAGEMERRMRAESELRQAQKLEAVGRLAAGIAHEINTPVQFVSDSLDFVRDSVGELLGVVRQLETVERSVLDGAPSREAAEAAAQATEAIDLPYVAVNLPKAIDRALDGLSRVATIVTSMKVFAHPDAPDMQTADLNQAIDSTLTIARNEYKDVAELETELGDVPPIVCYIGELNQAVLNIVVNAAHAIGDIVANTGAMGKIRVVTRCDQDDVVIAISDTGGGIPAEVQPHIFEPFFTTKAVGRGTGQGLAVAHSVVVDKHHGRLSFETAAGQGTTFFLRVPISGHAAAPAAT